MSAESPVTTETPTSTETPTYTGRLGFNLPTFDEAPVVVFTKLYGFLQGDDSGQVIEFNLTVRANTSQEALDKLFDAGKYAKEKYHMSLANPNVRKSPSPAGSTPTTPTGSAPSAPSAPKLPASSSPRVFHCVKLEVSYDANGKCTLKWYEANHRYPDIYTTRSPEKALELLQSTGEGWTAEHISKPATYPSIRHDVFYRESEKANSRGNPYKDIVEIRSV